MDPADKVFKRLARQRELFRSRVEAELRRARVALRAQLLSGRDGTLDTTRLRTIMAVVNSHVTRMERELASQFRHTIGEVLYEQAGQAAEISPASLEGHWLTPQLVQTYQEEAVADLTAAGQELRARIRRDFTGLVLRDETVYRAVNGVLSPRASLSGLKPAFTALEPRYASIARTKVSTAANAAHAATYNAAGSGSVEWRAALCTCHCVLCHQDLNGQRIPVGSLFHAQGRSFLHPPAHPNCRCYLVYHK